MRYILATLGGLALIGIGAVGWIGFQALTSPEQGAILGETVTANFWSGGALPLSRDGGQLQFWTAGAGAQPVPELAGALVTGFAVAPDDHSALVASMDGDMQVVRLYEEGKTPRVLMATRSELRSLAYSDRGRFATFLERRSALADSSLALLDTFTGRMERVADNAAGAVWVRDAQAFVVWHGDDAITYHAIGLNGEVAAPEFLGHARSTPTPSRTPNTVLILEQGSEGALFLSTFSLSTRATTRMLALPMVDTSHTLALSLAPAGGYALVQAVGPGTQNGTLVLVDTEDATATALVASARALQWVDATHVVIERAVGSGVELFLLDATTLREEKLATNGSARLLR